MSKIYIVISGSGEGEDYHEFIEKAFRDAKKAEAYLNELTSDNKRMMEMAERCRNCDGHDASCPLWIEPTDITDGCDNYINNAYYENIDYLIEEVELVE